MTLAPTTVVPSLAVVTAATLMMLFWEDDGFVNPGMANCNSEPALNVPVVNETVKTNGPAPDSAAVPAAPDAGAVKVRAAVPEFASARPAPVSVMMILPLLATAATGVSATLNVTAAAPLTTLLRVMAGAFVPRDSTMAGYVPVTLAPTMVVPSLAVVTAATLVMAA